MISSTYIHLFWVPAFPIRKDASLICKKCGLKRYDLDFDSRSLEGYKDLKSKFKHPFYTYIGAAFFLSIIVLSILVKVLHRMTEIAGISMFMEQAPEDSRIGPIG